MLIGRCLFAVLAGVMRFSGNVRDEVIAADFHREFDRELI